MDKKEILERLKVDEDYYGEFGQQYLSNSNIGTLFSNPLMLKEKTEPTSAMIVGGYFHTAILEPEKLKNFKVVDASTRNTKIYREESGEEMCLLKHEADKVDDLVKALLENDTCSDLINRYNVEYEVPNIVGIEGNMWKGKADIINHDKKLIVDLKTTSDINGFNFSAKKYNYDSQAYIYRKMFGYDMLFVVIDKGTQQIGLFDCSEEFYDRGADKVKKATEIYDMFYKTEGFNSKQFFINRTL